MPHWMRGSSKIDYVMFMLTMLVCVAAIILALLGLVAAFGGGDDRVCLSSHEESRTTTTFITAGKVIVPMTNTRMVDVCDVHATEVPTP